MQPRRAARIYQEEFFVWSRCEPWNQIRIGDYCGVLCAHCTDHSRIRRIAEHCGPKSSLFIGTSPGRKLFPRIPFAFGELTIRNDGYACIA
jgi:hypothetical protein